MLIEHISRDQNITYYAINKHGDLRTNNTSEGPNAVTWGVFPGKEIIQPTIVEAVSFMAWKDEAFELGRQWARLYETDSDSYKLINNIVDNYFLVNVVHNDFKDPDAIFRPFYAVGALVANGLANGHAAMVNGNINGHIKMSYHIPSEIPTIPSVTNGLMLAA